MPKIDVTEGLGSHEAEQCSNTNPETLHDGSPNPLYRPSKQ